MRSVKWSLSPLRLASINWKCQEGSSFPTLIWWVLMLDQPLASPTQLHNFPVSSSLFWLLILLPMWVLSSSICVPRHGWTEALIEFISRAHWVNGGPYFISHLAPKPLERSFIYFLAPWNFRLGPRLRIPRLQLKRKTTLVHPKKQRSMCDGFTNNDFNNPRLAKKALNWKVKLLTNNDNKMVLIRKIRFNFFYNIRPWF